MQTLTVINDCLGTMGELPLNAVDDPHPYRGACVSFLTKANRELQARGWTFNREQLTLQPSAIDSGIYLPGDTINVRASVATYVQRGRRLYDTSKGSYVFTKDVDVVLVRLVPFEDLPELFAAYVAAETVLRFQNRYDGDSTKTRRLEDERDAARREAGAEETRQVQANLIDSNARLSFIKSRVRAVRGQQY